MMPGNFMWNGPEIESEMTYSGQALLDFEIICTCRPSRNENWRRASWPE